MIRKANITYPIWDWPGSMNWSRASGKSSSWARCWALSSVWLKRSPNTWG